MGVVAATQAELSRRLLLADSDELWRGIACEAQVMAFRTGV